MKVYQVFSKVCTINGVQITVPMCKYITIDMHGRMSGWNDKPYLYDGFWYSDSEKCIPIGRMEMEDDDTIFSIFSVPLDRFLDYSDCDA